LERGNNKPVFVPDGLYYQSDLTFTEVFIKCRELGLKKMINISDETIQAWYVEFLREKWSSAKFKERIPEMINMKTYGERIDIADWFEKEAIYTPIQVASMVEKKINNILREADRILDGKEIEVELSSVPIDLEKVKYRIAKTITLYYDNEVEEQTNKLFEEMLSEVLLKLGLEKGNREEKRVGIGTQMRTRLKF
jgi:hypothetical protein